MPSAVMLMSPSMSMTTLSASPWLAIRVTSAPACLATTLAPTMFLLMAVILMLPCSAMYSPPITQVPPVASMASSVASRPVPSAWTIRLFNSPAALRVTMRPASNVEAVMSPVLLVAEISFNALTLALKILPPAVRVALLRASAETLVILPPVAVRVTILPSTVVLTMSPVVVARLALPVA
ncbi:MAG: hypothetical protein BWX73_01264 [Lentisphaerae bacterium ADurb.Bin082]|nr:MAG: hypothetical protein BWX73_01264 [Lentisphaerae bacterium ADurb.Bin082]